MTRSDLLTKLAESYPHLSVSEVEKILDTVFGAISTQLVLDGRIELRGFGVFCTVKRDGRLARNPRSGEPVEVPEKRVPWFTPSKLLNDRFNRRDGS